MKSNIVTLPVIGARPATVLSAKHDALAEHIAEDIDQIVKYALIPRRRILRFIRKKTRSEGSPFGIHPVVAWSLQQPDAYRTLMKHIYEPIALLHMTEQISEYTKYQILWKVYEYTRSKMRPSRVEYQAAERA